MRRHSVSRAASRDDRPNLASERRAASGTDRLSVVDASIIPNGPSAFTHLPTVNELRRRIRGLERALGRETYELEIAGEAVRGWE
jgi:hypothetical protein